MQQNKFNSLADGRARPPWLLAVHGVVRRPVQDDPVPGRGLDCVGLASDETVIMLASSLHPCGNAYYRERGVQQNDSLVHGCVGRQVGPGRPERRL